MNAGGSRRWRKRFTRFTPVSQVVSETDINRREPWRGPLDFEVHPVLEVHPPFRPADPIFILGRPCPMTGPTASLFFPESAPPPDPQLGPRPFTWPNSSTDIVSAAWRPIRHEQGIASHSHRRRPHQPGGEQAIEDLGSKPRRREVPPKSSGHVTCRFPPVHLIEAGPSPGPATLQETRRRRSRYSFTAGDVSPSVPTSTRAFSFGSSPSWRCPNAEPTPPRPHLPGGARPRS